MFFPGRLDLGERVNGSKRKMMGHTFSISRGMREANLSLRVGCFDEVDTNRVDKRANREGEED